MRCIRLIWVCWTRNQLLRLFGITTVHCREITSESLTHELKVIKKCCILDSVSSVLQLLGRNELLQPWFSVFITPAVLRNELSQLCFSVFSTSIAQEKWIVAALIQRLQYLQCFSYPEKWIVAALIQCLHYDNCPRRNELLQPHRSYFLAQAIARPSSR